MCTVETTKEGMKRHSRSPPLPVIDHPSCSSVTCPRLLWRPTALSRHALTYYLLITAQHARTRTLPDDSGKDGRLHQHGTAIVDVVDTTANGSVVWLPGVRTCHLLLSLQDNQPTLPDNPALTCQRRIRGPPQHTKQKKKKTRGKSENRTPVTTFRTQYYCH